MLPLERFAYPADIAVGGQRGQVGIERRDDCGTQCREIVEVEHNAFARYLAAVSDIEAGNEGGNVDQRGGVKRDDERCGTECDQPFIGAVKQDAQENEEETDRDETHPYAGGNAQFGQRINLDIEIEPQNGGKAEQDVLRDPQKHEAAQQRASIARPAAVHGGKHEDGGKDCGEHQRIGTAMGIFGMGHAIGQASSAPEIGKIEQRLHGKQGVEDEQRAQQSIMAEQQILGSRDNIGDFAST